MSHAVTHTNITILAAVSGMLIRMTVRAVFSGGPHDGAERDIDAPFPRLFTVVIDGHAVDYHYAGFKDGTAYYGYEPILLAHAA